MHGGGSIACFGYEQGMVCLTRTVAYRCQCTGACIIPVGFEVRAEEGKSVIYILKIYFIGVYDQSIIRFQVVHYNIFDIYQKILIRVHEKKVVYITTIMPYFQFAFNPVVEIRKIYITEHLAGEVADR